MKVERGTWLIGGSENEHFCAACFAPFVRNAEIFGASQRVRGQYVIEAPKLAGGSRFMGATCSKIDDRWKIQGAKMAFPGRPPLRRLRRRFAPLRGSAAPLRGASRRPSGALRARRLRRRKFCKHARGPFKSREASGRESG